MSIPAALKNRNEGDDDQGKGDESEQDMGDKNWKIDPRDQTGVPGRFFTGIYVINNVANEKPGRCDQRDDHARDMSLPDVATNPEPACRNENGADRV